MIHSYTIYKLYTQKDHFSQLLKFNTNYILTLHPQLLEIQHHPQ